MPLDATEIEQLKEAVKTDTLPDFLKPVAEAGYKLFNEKQLDDFKGQSISEKVNEAFSFTDKAVKEVFGIDKLAGEKATDYLKRAAKETKDELSGLKEKAKEGKLSDYEKERLTQLEGQLNTQKTEFEKERDAWKAERLQTRVNNDLSSALDKVKGKLKKDLTGDLLTDVVDVRIGRFQKDYKAEIVKENDKDILIYRNEKGEVVQNENHKPASAEYILDNMFKPYFESKVEQQGSGSGKAGNNSPAPTDRPTKDTYKPGNDVTTRIQLSDDLKKNGFAAGTDEYSDLLKKYSVKADGTALPLGR